MTDFQDDLERRFALQHAVEARFGKPSSWTLKIQAAYAQLETMQRLMGDDYAPFIRLARQAIRQHRTRKSSVLYFRRDHLGRLLHPDGVRHESVAADLGWAINNCLESLLGDDDYEQIIEAAVDATATSYADTH